MRLRTGSRKPSTPSRSRWSDPPGAGVPGWCGGGWARVRGLVLPGVQGHVEILMTREGVATGLALAGGVLIGTAVANVLLVWLVRRTNRTN